MRRARIPAYAAKRKVLGVRELISGEVCIIEYVVCTGERHIRCERMADGKSIESIGPCTCKPDNKAA